jgi:phosphoribosylformylglycinamidine cyclo-ligase
MAKEKKTPKSYAESGVDIRKEVLTIRGIVSWASKTFRFRQGRVGEVMRDIGTFANVIDLGDCALAMTSDGVGSKVLIAQELDKYDTVGIDLVAMNVNDLLCIGAEPIAMVDYYAVTCLKEDIASEIGKGLFEGAREAEIAIVGGETATLPDMICGVGNKGFDLAASAIGLVKKDRIITGEKIAVGDVVVGFRSSGIHSNGLTLARKVLPKTMWNTLLTPTRIYVKDILHVIGSVEVHGMAHITGTGMLNLSRITPYGFKLDKLPEPPIIFKKIQEFGAVSDEEMYKTFNMGVGFCVICDKSAAQKILNDKEIECHREIIGEIVKEPGITVIKEGKTLKIE